jgi:hypothetical protein
MLPLFFGVRTLELVFVKPYFSLFESINVFRWIDEWHVFNGIAIEGLFNYSKLSFGLKG